MSEEPPGAEAPLLGRQVLFDHLDSTDFEEFCFDLLEVAGFVNVDWRKGTPKQASPSDQGRDIVAHRQLVDVDGHVYTEKWFVECKHWKSGVRFDALQNVLSWAEAERPDVVLVITSGYLANQAKGGLESYARNNRPRFRIRHWEKGDLARMLGKHPQLLARHHVFTIEEMRKEAEILAAEEECFERLWFYRSVCGDYDAWKEPGKDLPPDIEEGMMASRHRIVEKYGLEELRVETSWEHGLLSGKLSALRWVTGYEWDFLDT